MPGDDIDLIDLHLTRQLHRRDLGGQAGTQLLGHGLHIRDIQVEFSCDLPVRQVEAHEIETEHPDPQGLMMTSQHGAGQVVKAGAAGRAAVALAMRLSIVPTVTGHCGAAAVRAAYAVRPAVLPDKREALGVIEQRGKVHQRRGCHGHHRAVGENPSTAPLG